MVKLDGWITIRLVCETASARVGREYCKVGEPTLGTYFAKLVCESPLETAGNKSQCLYLHGNNTFACLGTINLVWRLRIVCIVHAALSLNVYLGLVKVPLALEPGLPVCLYSLGRILDALMLCRAAAADDVLHCGRAAGARLHGCTRCKVRH